MATDAPDIYLEAAFLCDYASEYGGRITAMGMFANQIQAPELPVIGQAMLVARVGYVAKAMHDHDFRFKIEILDPDQNPIGSLEADAHIPGSRGAPSGPEGISPAVQLIVPLTFPIQQVGLHHVILTIDGDRVGSTMPVHVSTASPATT